MVVVWGWGYYFRKNIQYVFDQCDNCRQSGPLHCYDAIYFFTLYYCPFIPLGRKHVFRECPKCKHGARMPQSKYRKLIDGELMPAIEKADHKPTDRDAAIGALAIAIQTCHKDGFQRAAAVASRNWRSDKDVARLIATGYSMFGDKEEAERTLTTALAAADAPDIRRQLIGHYAETGHPDKGTPHVRHLLDTEGEAAVELALYQGGVLQSAGHHRDVVALMDTVKSRFPNAHPASVSRLLDASNQLRDASIPPVISGFKSLPKPKRGILPALIVPTLLLVGVGIYLFLCLFGKPKHAYLVNGLDSPYTVVVNGESVFIPPKTKTPMPATFGSTRVEPGSNAPPFDPIEFEIDTGFFARPFDDDVYIVNPDSLAGILWEQSAYAENPNAAPQGSFMIHAGKPYYTFEDIDVVFAPLPAEIRLPSRNSIVYRTRVDIDPTMTRSDIIVTMFGVTDTVTAIPYIKKAIATPPTDQSILTIASLLIPPQEFRPLIESQLPLRPVRMQLHQYWQSLTEALEPDRDLAGEYRALLDADPENRALAYLTGRLVEDHDESIALYKQSIQPPNPEPYGHYGLAFTYACEADFDKAVEHARQATDSIPDDSLIAEFYESILNATGDITTLEARLTDRAYGTDADQIAATSLVRSIAARDRKLANDRANSAIQHAKTTWSVKSSDPSIVEFRSACDLAIIEGAGDRDELLAHLDNLATPDAKVRAALLRQNVETVGKLLAEQPEDAFIDQLTAYALCYLIAEKQENKSASALSVFAMLNKLDNSTNRDKKIAAWLRSDEPPSPIQVARQSYPGTATALRLCLFAARYPDRADDYLRLARKHNYERSYPRNILEDLIKPLDD